MIEFNFGIAMKCPHCGHRVDHGSLMFGEDARQPAAKTIGVCLYCAALVVVGKLECRKLNFVEMKALMESPGDYNKVTLIRQAREEYLKERGGAT